MRFTETPFWLLDVSLEDEAETIEERAEELAEEQPDGTDWEGLAQRLRKPRDRVECEVAWLPGMAPEVARKLAHAVGPDRPVWKDGKPVDDDILAQRTLPDPEWWRQAERCPLAWVNLRLRPLEMIQAEPRHVAGDLLRLAEKWARVDTVAVAQQINRHRAKAEIRAKVTEEMVAEAVEKRQGWIQHLVKGKLDASPTAAMVETVRLLSQEGTKNGTQRAPEAVRDWLRMYERECRPYFKAQLDAVSRLMQQAESGIRRKDAKRAEELVGKVQQALGSWDRVAQPIQLLHQGEGSVDPITDEMFRKSREFGIRLNNEHGMASLALRIAKTQREVFHEAERLAEQAGADTKALESILGSRR